MKAIQTYLTQTAYLNGIRINDDNNPFITEDLKKEMKSWNKSQHQYALSNTIEFALENSEDFLEGYEVKNAWMTDGYNSGIVMFTDGSILTINIEEVCEIC